MMQVNFLFSDSHDIIFDSHNFASEYNGIMDS